MLSSYVYRRTLYNNNIVFNSSRYKTLYKYLQGTSTRCAHDDIRRLSSYYITTDEKHTKHTKPKHSRKPGVGGTSEEKSISQALRIIHERNYQVIIEVMNACHVDWAEKQLPIRKDHNKIWARVLTHSDLLSKEALQYQMERASIVRNISSSSSSVGGDGGSTYQIPVVALNLQDTTIKNSKLRAQKWDKMLVILQISCGATILVKPNHAAFSFSFAHTAGVATQFC